MFCRGAAWVRWWVPLDDIVHVMSSMNETPQDQTPQTKRPSSEARAFYWVVAMVGLVLLVIVLAMVAGVDFGLGNQGVGLTAVICGLVGAVLLALGIKGVNQGR